MIRVRTLEYSLGGFVFDLLAYSLINATRTKTVDLDERFKSFLSIINIFLNL